MNSSSSNQLIKYLISYPLKYLEQSIENTENQCLYGMTSNL